MKKLKQFIFYGAGSDKNFPTDLNKWKNNLLAEYGSVSHLGIQGNPGTIFYLNHSGDPISIGTTGVYELNLEGVGYISSLRFDMDVLNTTYDNPINPKYRLIVDIVYEGGGKI